MRKQIANLLHRLGDWIYTQPVMQLPIDQARPGDLIVGYAAFRGVDKESTFDSSWTRIAESDEVSVYYKVAE